MNPLLVSAILAGVGIYALKYLMIYQQLEEKKMYDEWEEKQKYNQDDDGDRETE